MRAKSLLALVIALVAFAAVATGALADTGAEATAIPSACKFAHDETFTATCVENGTITSEEGSATAVWGDGPILSLTKDALTEAYLVAQATINGFADDPLFQLSFDYRGYCGNGAPRFNVYEGNSVHFFGCGLGQHTDLEDGWTHVEFDCTEPGSDCPAEAFIIVSGIQLIQDEQGTTQLRNITVNDILITPPAAPAAPAEGLGPRGEYCAAVAVHRPGQDDGRYLDLLLGQNVGPEWGFANAVPAYEQSPGGAKTCDLYGWHTTGQTDGPYPLIVRG